MLSEYLTYHRINCNKSAYISIIKKYYGDQIFSGYGIREGGRGKLNTAA